MKILAHRDENIDVCKTFLVLGMILAHVLLWFYVDGRVSHWTFCFTLGFILYSGFVIAAVYHDRILKDFRGSFRRAALRAFKFILIFAFGNWLMTIFLPERGAAFSDLDPLQLAMSAVLLNSQSLFAFDVLVPIGLTFLLAPVVVLLGNSRTRSATGALALWALVALGEAIEPNGIRGLLYVAVGLIGSLLACLAHTFDWSMVVTRLRQSLALPVSLLIAWLAYLGLLSSSSYPTVVTSHVAPTILMLSAVYALSATSRSYDWRPLRLLTGPISTHMLFAYLFHLVVLRLCLVVLPPNTFSLAGSLLFAAALTALTAATCAAVEHLTRRNRLFATLYALVFH